MVPALMRLLCLAQLYDGTYYPPYADGGGYWMGRQALTRAMAYHSKQSVFPIEDAYMGVLMAKAHISPVAVFGIPGKLDIVEHKSQARSSAVVKDVVKPSICDRADQCNFGIPPPAISDSPHTAPLNASCKIGTEEAVPNIVHQIWLGGRRLMYVKLLSVLSVHYLMRPASHFLYYDEPADQSMEWKCACTLATCVKVERGVEAFSIPTRHRAADMLSNHGRRCSNIALDQLRIDVLQRHGGVYLDLDAYVLQPLDSWRRCSSRTVLGIDATTGAPNTGVIFAPRDSFLGNFSRTIHEGGISASEFGECNQIKELTALSPEQVYLAPELGPFRRQASAAAYKRELDAVPLAHLSSFSQRWRLYDSLNARVLEPIWARVAEAIGRSDPSKINPEVQRCIETIEGACWAKPGMRC